MEEMKNTRSDKSSSSTFSALRASLPGPGFEMKPFRTSNISLENSKTVVHVANKVGEKQIIDNKKHENLESVKSSLSSSSSSSTSFSSTSFSASSALLSRSSHEIKPPRTLDSFLEKKCQNYFS
jgi:hypothetical protein